MVVSLRYVGTYRRRITWNSMGQCFCYVVNPGDIIDVPASQANNAKGAAPLVEAKLHATKAKRIKKIFEAESTEVITPSDEEVFEKQDKLDPFAGCKSDGQEVVIEEETEVVEDKKEVVEAGEVVAEQEPEITEDVQKEVENEFENLDKAFPQEFLDKLDKDIVPDTDFASKNKSDLADYIIAHSQEELKKYVLLKEKRDTLIKMCVDLESSL